MNIPYPTEEHRDPTETHPDTASTDSNTEVRDLMLRAATRAAEQGLDLDGYMRVAWLAYMEASPGLRQQLEEMQLAAQFEALRRSGRLGQA